MEILITMSLIFSPVVHFIGKQHGGLHNLYRKENKKDGIHKDLNRILVSRSQTFWEIKLMGT